MQREVLRLFGQCTKSKTKLFEFSKIAFCIINDAFVKRICMPPPCGRGMCVHLSVCDARVCMCICACVLMTCSQIQINIFQQSQRHRSCKTAVVSVAKNDGYSACAKSGKVCVLNNYDWHLLNAQTYFNIFQLNFLQNSKWICNFI